MTTKNVKFTELLDCPSVLIANDVIVVKNDASGLTQVTPSSVIVTALGPLTQNKVTMGGSGVAGDILENTGLNISGADRSIITANAGAGLSLNADGAITLQSLPHILTLDPAVGISLTAGGGEPIELNASHVRVNNYSLPVLDGLAGQIMQTDGAGQVNFVNPPSSSVPFSMFYGLTAGTGSGGTDYAATIAVKTGAGTGRVPFPQLGPTAGSAPTIAIGATSPALIAEINLPNIGVYEVTYKVHTTELGQLQLELNGVDVPLSETANMNPTAGGHPLVGNCLISTVSINSKLALVNCAGNASALTITPADGNSTHANAQTITIKQIA